MVPFDKLGKLIHYSQINVFGSQLEPGFTLALEGCGANWLRLLYVMPLHLISEAREFDIHVHDTFMISEIYDKPHGMSSVPSDATTAIQHVLVNSFACLRIGSGLNI